MNKQLVVYPIEGPIPDHFCIYSCFFHKVLFLIKKILLKQLACSFTEGCIHGILAKGYCFKLRGFEKENVVIRLIEIPNKILNSFHIFRTRNFEFCLFQYSPASIKHNILLWSQAMSESVFEVYLNASIKRRHWTYWFMWIDPGISDITNKPNQDQTLDQM